MTNECKHNRLRANLERLERNGKFNKYCLQCQKWVDVVINKKDPIVVQSKLREDVE